MRLALALALAFASPAAAETAFGTAGLGSSYAANEPGWMLRTEIRQDFDDHGDRDAALVGSRLGLELWQSASHTGFDVPLGFYWGAQIDSVRVTLGFGAGLWNIDYHDDRAFHGIAPFVATSVEVHREKLLVSLDVRMSRSIVSDSYDLNIYSVMLMVGKRRD